MEGPVCLPHLRSFIGIAEIPLRHGMTIGELAQFFNVRSLRQPADLTVVPLAGYQRSMLSPALYAHLSPNIKTMKSVFGYSFLGLVGEVEPFHVGVGTPHAFQVIMLSRDLNVPPDAWRDLQFDLLFYGIESNLYDAYHDGKKKDFEGLKLHFSNMNDVSGFKALLTVLAWAKKYKIPICFKPTFDISVGSPDVRRWYQSNKPIDVLHKHVKQQVQEFLDANHDVLLYDEMPKVVRGSRPFDPVCA
jgi:hypothetical protein